MSSVDSALDRLWHFLTSMKLAMVLMLVFAALGLVGHAGHPGARRRDGRPSGEGGVAGFDPPQVRRLDGPHGPPPVLRDLHLGLAAGRRRPAGSFARGLHRAPDPGHLADHAASERDGGPGLLRARAPARGDDLPPRAGPGPGRGHRGLQAPPLPDRHRGRRHGPPLRGPQQLGAVGGPGSPHQHRRDPGRRDGRLHVRLP